jgi:general stress protein 26
LLSFLPESKKHLMSTQESVGVPEPNLVKLRSLLEGARIAMLTTLDEQGHLCSRPMVMQALDHAGNLWFFTGLHTHLATELNRDTRMNVSVVHGNTYLSISGEGTLVEDPKKASEMWSPLYKAWFPKGLEDPDLTLVRVRVDRAAYWDSPGGVVTTLIGYVKSLATGQAADVGEHGELGVSHRSAS